MALFCLALAIAFEVTATLTLRAATHGRRRWYAVVVVGYLLSFGALTLALDVGLGIGAAYGIWSATGVAVTAVASRVLFDEPLTVVMALGIVLIAGGVLFIETGAGG